MMAGIRKELGPAARRLADALRRIRRGQDITTAEMSRRLTALGQPVPDTGITKTEHGARRVDVDDLMAISLALGVTPNTLLMPQVNYLGAGERHHLTPVADGTAEELWQWAQGEKPLRVPVPGADTWLGDDDHPALRFSLRSRPYLTAAHPPGAGAAPEAGMPGFRAIVLAVTEALAKGATGAEVRRVVELTITLPAVMPDTEIRERAEAKGKGRP
jgi:transcriptional regulator with XRE-family HTH domain